MPTFITDNIMVSVLPKYEEKHSNPLKSDYVFSYDVEITNEGSSTVQLLSRHWYIFDSNGQYTEVKGEGVIGQQPIILPRNTHRYQSFCKLTTDIGLMWGTYLMKVVDSGRMFRANIPEFQMITPMRLN